MGKVDRITSGVSRLGTAVATTWNPNHRHDEEWEKEIDRRIEDIRDGHRFRSFAPEREGNMVKWHIDGHGGCRANRCSGQLTGQTTFGRCPR